MCAGSLNVSINAISMNLSSFQSFRVVQLQEENKMSIENLGIVFGPTLMRPPSNQPVIDDLYMIHFQKKSVEIMIEEFDTLFQK